jgi:hypothetical protein
VEAPGLGIHQTTLMVVVFVIATIVGITVCVWQVKKRREQVEQLESIKHVDEPDKMESFLSKFSIGSMLRVKGDSGSIGVLKPKKTAGSVSKDSQMTFVDNSRISFGAV